jgi:hypothetical protein
MGALRSYTAAVPYVPGRRASIYPIFRRAQFLELDPLLFLSMHRRTFVVFANKVVSCVLSEAACSKDHPCPVPVECDLLDGGLPIYAESGSLVYEIRTGMNEERYDDYCFRMLHTVAST